MVLNKRLLILSAGSVASNNLVRSLKSGDSSLFIVGSADDRFALKRSLADRHYLVPSSSHQLLRALKRIIEAERIDLLIANTDVDVGKISKLADRLPCRTFLPKREVIERCGDKLELTTFLRRRGIAVPATYPVRTVDELEKLFRRLSPHSRLWCRIREGSGSIGAIPVKNAEQARWWIRYWEDMRGISSGMFTLAEYLPGRDITAQCLFKNGTLVMAKTLERLSYNVIGGGPSGVSSTAALGQMIFAPRVVRICVKAITALDPKASGAFSVDLKENAAEMPCITEINAGRFANGPIVHDLAGEPNIAVTYVRLALGERVKIAKPRRYPDDCFILRHLDMPPAVLYANDLFEGIEDLRS
jgi:glutathione synthase/RimK-type ligase-like ATP-grasp enzyme